jgi:hypothetical protein
MTVGAGQGSPRAVFGFLCDDHLSEKQRFSENVIANTTHMNTVGTDGSGIRTSSACCLYYIDQISESQEYTAIAR